MTYDQIAETMPDEYAARAANKLKYKYPQGESYTDVMQRLGIKVCK
jgi:6-phosphofructo-2-kinase/fructose-2,6-biphosphatase